MAQPPGPLPVSEKPLTPMAMEECDQMEKYTGEEATTAVTFTAEEEKGLLRRFDWILLPIMVGSARLSIFSVQVQSDASESPFTVFHMGSCVLRQSRFQWKLAQMIDSYAPSVSAYRSSWVKQFSSICVRIWIFCSLAPAIPT